MATDEDRAWEAQHDDERQCRDCEQWFTDDSDVVLYSPEGLDQFFLCVGCDYAAEVQEHLDAERANNAYTNMVPARWAGGVR